MSSALPKVIVALSGGVDSAVAALLLRRAGHPVEGLYMHNWEDDEQGYCSSAQDYQDARAVAAELGIALHRVDLSAQYRDRVFAHFLAEYRAGRTPNPDVLCNREIKFGDCLAHARRLGAEWLATGHYARIVQSPEGPVLLKGVDPAKDQSYFLHAVRRADFSRVLMPIGELHKPVVRELAREAGLPVFAKRDSTGICFIGERPFRDFLNRYISKEPGPIKNPKGHTIGEHVGLSFYTLGQRQGLGIGGLKTRGAQRGGGEHEPWFVARKDMEHNTLWVVQGHEHPWLQSSQLTAQDTSWCAGAPPANGPLAAKTRYRQADAPCQFQSLSAEGFALTFAQPQWAVTPGQSAVVYDGDVCLGGGIIASKGDTR